MLTISEISEYPNVTPVKALFKLVETYCVLSCNKPSTTIGTSRAKSMQLGISIKNAVTQALNSPIIIPVHLAHTGS